MFFVLRLRRTIIVPPEELGPLFRRRLEGHLRKAVEGAEVQPYGLVIAVVDIYDADKISGKILDDGSVKVVVDYEAIVFRLSKGEVVDAIVDRVTPEGLFCEVGPAVVHIPRPHISDEFLFDATSALVARYVSADGSKSIAPGKVVRCRILAEVVRSKDIAFRALATTMEPFLGVRD